MIQKQYFSCFADHLFKVHLWNQQLFNLLQIGDFVKKANPSLKESAPHSPDGLSCECQSGEVHLTLYICLWSATSTPLTLKNKAGECDQNMESTDRRWNLVNSLSICARHGWIQRRELHTEMITQISHNWTFSQWCLQQKQTISC